MKYTRTSCLIGALSSVTLAVKLVDSEALQASITTETLFRHAQALEDIAYATPQGNRVMGSDGHNNTVRYILDQLEPLQYYYNVEVEPFQVVYFEGSASFSRNGEDSEAAAFRYTPSADIELPIVLVRNGGCSETDYPLELAGNIALISRGTTLGATCGTGARAVLAGNAGAKAAIMYNDVPGRPIGGYATPALNGENYIPAAAIRLDAALPIIEAINNGEEVVGKLHIEGVTESRTTMNILATTKIGAPDKVLFIGAHSDSVVAGPGINDNGSGTIGLLAVAQNLPRWGVKNTVRFGWWGAEEFGLLGSTYHVNTLPEEELAKIQLYLNFDMIGSPNAMLGVYDGDGSRHNLTGPAGSDKAEAFFHDHFRSKGLNSTETAFTGRSDYGPFLKVNIPSGGLFTGAEGLKSEEEAAMFGGTAGLSYDINYHYAGDTVANLNADAFLANSQAIAASVAHYGMDLSEIPIRDPAVSSAVARRREVIRGPMIPKAHGSCGSEWE